MMALLSEGGLADAIDDYRIPSDDDDDKQPEISTIPLATVVEDDDLSDDEGNDGDISNSDGGDSGYSEDENENAIDEENKVEERSSEIMPAMTKRIGSTFNIAQSCGGSPTSFSSPFRRMISPPLPLFSAYKSRELKPPKTIAGLRFLQHGPTHIHWHPPELEPLQILTPNEKMYLAEEHKRDLYRQIPDKLVVYDSVYTYEELEAMGATAGNQVYSVLSPGYNNQPMKTGPIKSSFYAPKGLQDTTLVFESRFETGNLRRAVQMDEFEYDLMLRPDIKTDFHTQWFYFCVTNTRAGTEYRFNIINHGKAESMYSKGMRPLMYSVKAAAERGKGWVRVGSRICYYPNHFKFCRRKKPKGYNSLSFTVTTEYSMDAVYFAMCYPYTYTDLGRYLKSIEEDPKKRLYVRRRTLCRTLAGNDCDMLTITHFESDHEEIASRKAVVATARVHPGETNASWMMKGMIDFLVGESREAQVLRKNFIFKVVPMLNPDGVIHGNYRCSLAGVDLNRNWMNPSKALHPTVYHTKEMIRRVAETRQLLMCVDFHGHSTKSNIFCYGCDNKHDRNIRNTERVFPRMLWDKNSNVFSFSDCSFNMSKSKRHTMRIVLRNEIGLINSYTCEASFAGSTTGPNAGNHFTMLHLQRMGYLWGRCILDYCNPEKRAKTLDDLEVLETSMPVDIAMGQIDDGSGGSSDDDDDEFAGLGLSSMAKRRRKRKKKKKKKGEEDTRKTKQKSGDKAQKQGEGKRKGKLKQKVKTIIKMKRPIDRMKAQNGKKGKAKRTEKEGNSKTSVTVSGNKSSVTVTVTVTTNSVTDTTVALERSKSTAVVKPCPPDNSVASTTKHRRDKRLRGDGPVKTQKEVKGNRAWTEKEKDTRKARAKPAGRKASITNTTNSTANNGKNGKKNGKLSRKKNIRKNNEEGNDKVVVKKKKLKKKASSSASTQQKNKASKASKASKAKVKAKAEKALAEQALADQAEADQADQAESDQADRELKFENYRVPLDVHAEESEPAILSPSGRTASPPTSPSRLNVRRVWAGTHGGAEMADLQEKGTTKPTFVSRLLLQEDSLINEVINEMDGSSNRDMVGSFRQPPVSSSFLSSALADQNGMHSNTHTERISPNGSFAPNPNNPNNPNSGSLSGRRASQPVGSREGSIEPGVIGFLGGRRRGSTGTPTSMRPGSVDSYYSGSRPRTPVFSNDPMASTLQASVEGYLATSMGSMNMGSQPIFPAISPAGNSRGKPTFSPSSTAKFF